MGNKRQYPWEFIEEVYVQGDDDVTLQAMHDTLLLEQIERTPSLQTLKERCAEGKWVEKRQQYRYNIQTQVRANAREHEVEIRTKLLKIGRQLEAIGMRRIINATDNGEISPFLALQILKHGQHTERQALGMSDATLELKSWQDVDVELLKEVARIAGVSEEDARRILEEDKA